MAILGTLKLKVATGTEYKFTVYSADTSFEDDLACVYYISKRSDDGRHKNIYIGQTEDLEDRLANHHKQSCFDSHSYNAVSIHMDGNEQSRLDKESDLIYALNPSCND